MSIRWPFMLRRTHETIVTALKHNHDRNVINIVNGQDEYVRVLRESYQSKVDAEHARATQEGRQQVHAWAREANWNIFWGIDAGLSGGFRGDQRSKSHAALQDAERQFAPSKTTLEIPAGEEEK